jgi:hypothetical protein
MTCYHVLNYLFQNSVMSSFISFLQLVRADFTSDEQIIIGCPSQEQIAVMITSLQLQPKTPRQSTSSSSEVRSPTAKPPPTSQQEEETAEKDAKVEKAPSPLPISPPKEVVSTDNSVNGIDDV